MERKTCFYKCIVAFVVMICSTITMSAQTKVTSARLLLRNNSKYLTLNKLSGKSL